MNVSRLLGHLKMVNLQEQMDFLQIFWNDVIDLVIDSYQYTYDLNEMSISQRQSIITLLLKPEKDTKYSPEY